MGEIREDPLRPSPILLGTADREGRTRLTTLSGCDAASAAHLHDDV
ncbi:hypothetical protein ACGFMK_36615 [Amycolatopsis sp. NPDC049252]